MMKKLPIVVLFCALSACAQLDPGASLGDDQIATTKPLARPNTAQPPPSNAVTAEQFDTTTAAERAAAIAPTPAVASERELGRTVASLGNPTDPGFWLETPLVSTETQGRVVYPATGKSVAVTLIPIEGPATAASRISLAALRLLGAPLTGLPELIVFAG